MLQAEFWQKVKKHFAVAPKRPALRGCVDRIENGKFIGWAYSPSKPGKRINVDLYLNEQWVMKAKADPYREDLSSFGTGKYAFSLQLSKEVLSQDKSLLRVVPAEDQEDLPRPETLVVMRKKLSNQYLFGEGIVIDALHNPFWVGEKVEEKYVDEGNFKEFRTKANEFLGHASNILPVVGDTSEIISMLKTSAG